MHAGKGGLLAQNLGHHVDSDRGFDDGRLQLANLSERTGTVGEANSDIDSQFGRAMLVGVCEFCLEVAPGRQRTFDTAQIVKAGRLPIPTRELSRAQLHHASVGSECFLPFVKAEVSLSADIKDL